MILQKQRKMFMMTSQVSTFVELQKQNNVRWWLHDPGLPGYFNPSSCDRFHPYNYMGKSNFIPAMRNSFPPGICLDLFTFFKIFLCKHVFFISLRRAEAITWKNFVPAKRDSGSTKEGSRLAEMKLFTCNHRI